VFRLIEIRRGTDRDGHLKGKVTTIYIKLKASFKQLVSSARTFQIPAAWQTSVAIALSASSFYST
jgi:hypothetical protein